MHADIVILPLYLALRKNESRKAGRKKLKCVPFFANWFHYLSTFSKHLSLLLTPLAVWQLLFIRVRARADVVVVINILAKELKGALEEIKKII